ALTRIGQSALRVEVEASQPATCVSVAQGSGTGEIGGRSLGIGRNIRQTGQKQRRQAVECASIIQRAGGFKISDSLARIGRNKAIIQVDRTQLYIGTGISRLSQIDQNALCRSEIWSAEFTLQIHIRN